MGRPPTPIKSWLRCDLLLQRNRQLVASTGLRRAAAHICVLSTILLSVALTAPLNRTGANGRDVEIVRSAVLRQNDYMITHFQ
jgi:hypothetical protein